MDTEEKDDVLEDEILTAVEDTVFEQPVDSPEPDEKPPVEDPPSENVDPVEKESEALTAVTKVHQSRDQYSVASIVRDAPDGAVVKCRDEKDVFAVQDAAANAGKDISTAYRQLQEARFVWRIPGADENRI